MMQKTMPPIARQTRHLATFEQICTRHMGRQGDRANTGEGGGDQMRAAQDENQL